MDALYQIGQDIGTLRSRVEVLEKRGRCKCHGASRGLRDAEMTPAQRRTVKYLRANREVLIEAVQKALAEVGLGKAAGEELHVSGLYLSPPEQYAELRRRGSSGSADECCICCPSGNYCCAMDCNFCCPETHGFGGGRND